MLVSSSSNRKQLPPYVSYRTFWNFLEGLQQAIPARIDRSYWGERFSGSNGIQLTAALRFLDLTDISGFPTGKLRQLVANRGPQRADILKQVIRDAYSFLFQDSFDPQNATYAQLEEAFHDNYQIASDVARKCIKFFIRLASDGGITVSPFVINKKTTTPGMISRRAGRKTMDKKNRTEIPILSEKGPDGNNLDKLLIDKFPPFDPSWPAELQAHWFTSFEQLLKRTGGVPEKK
jgi:hypothetical protein